MPKRLTDAQIASFRESGCLRGLPRVFDERQVAEMNAGYAELKKLLRPDETPKDIREWHEASRYLYDLGTNPVILDYVEDLLGPDFFLWASNFFEKPARSKETVGWHQDAFYWPMKPHTSLTVWIAFTDSDVGNGAMRVVPGTHKAGILKHARSTSTDSVLTLELEQGSFRDDAAVPIELAAGEVALHDEKTVHGSPANPSDRPRVGLTFRYSPTEVKNDLSVNPNFRAYLMRGVDAFRHNPAGVVPTARFGRIAHKPVSVEEVGVESKVELGPEGV